MHIIRFEAQNIQRLQAVTIEPGADAPAVVLAGGNEEGKSSCLDAIEMALAGERVTPPEPIRRGQDKAHVVVDLGDMVVTRRYTAKGSSLTVTNREGLKYPSPQSLLDGLYNKLTFDPMAFATAKPADQVVTLRTLAGIDTADLDKERAMVFATRTDVNRDLARAKAVLEKTPQHGDVGAEPQDLQVLVAQLGEADRLAQLLADADRAVTLTESEELRSADRVRRADTAVDAARRALAQAEEELEAARIANHHASDAHVMAKKGRAAAAAAIPDVAALRSQLAGVQEHNRKVEANTRRATLAADVAALQQTADGHTARVDAIDVEKANRLAAATFPIDGLGLNEHGITWNGLPFEQASTAIRTRVSVAIGFALNPKLRILLVRNGNDLDEKNLKLLATAAADAGGQVWIERIAGGDGLQTVVIEDGAVKGAARPAEGGPPDATVTPSSDDAPAKSNLPAPETAPRARRRSAGLFAEGSSK